MSRWLLLFFKQSNIPRLNLRLTYIYRDSLQLAFADLVSNGESSFLAAMDPTGEHALQKYSDVVQG
jgi:hypothetical protein